MGTKLEETVVQLSNHLLALNLRDDFGKAITDLKTFNSFKLWEKTRDELFAMGEARDAQDPPPRDMPASVGLKLLGWRSNTPMKRTFSWFDIDLSTVEMNTKHP